MNQHYQHILVARINHHLKTHGSLTHDHSVILRSDADQQTVKSLALSILSRKYKEDHKVIKAARKASIIKQWESQNNAR